MLDSPTYTIILAAGQSSRMNFPKGLLSYSNNVPWILEQIRRCLHYYLESANSSNKKNIQNKNSSTLESIIIVLGYNNFEYRTLFDKLIFDDLEYWKLFPEKYQFIKEQLGRVHLVINPNPELGQFSSLQTGLIELKKIINTSNIELSTFVTLIDVPYPNHKTCSIIKKTLLDNNNLDAVIPEFEGKGGHPILINNKIINHILNIDLNNPLEKDTRLDKLLSNPQLSLSIKRIEVNDSQITMNLNTLDKWKNYINHN